MQWEKRRNCKTTPETPPTILKESQQSGGHQGGNHFNAASAIASRAYLDILVIPLSVSENKTNKPT